MKSLFSNIRTGLYSLFASTTVSIVKVAAYAAGGLILLGGLFRAGAYTMTSFKLLAKATMA